ncbi:MAG: hypothetical protein ACLQU2_13745 [Candidatus Binataceae bacterium]
MNQGSNAIDTVVKSILKKTGVLGAKELEAWKEPHVEIRKLARTDYGECLRRELTAEHVKELVSRATDIWPQFNRAIVGPPSEQVLSRTAGALRLHLKSAPYNSLALYGFYVDPSQTSLQKPLIYVNSAHHQLAIGTAFCHEVGHHFCNEISKPKSSGLRFYFDAAYGEHLRDQGELSADIIVSLAGYPQETARTMLPAIKPSDGSRKGLNDAVFSAIRKHLKKSYGFDFSSKLLPGQNLQYLAGMIHYAKLRMALLQEYGI